MREPGQMFFVSSRRRHTRSLCDWSSDVCSSDLEALQRLEQSQKELNSALEKERELSEIKSRFVAMASQIGRRRVGKECRSRRRQAHRIKSTTEAGGRRARHKAAQQR